MFMHLIITVSYLGMWEVLCVWCDNCFKVSFTPLCIKMSWACLRIESVKIDDFAVSGISQSSSTPPQTIKKIKLPLGKLLAVAKMLGIPLTDRTRKLSYWRDPSSRCPSFSLRFRHFKELLQKLSKRAVFFTLQDFTRRVVF